MSAPKGNKYNEKYPLEDCIVEFNKVIDNAKKGKFLSIQEAIISTKYPRAIFYYLCNLHQDLDDLKKELNDIIIAIVNRKALEGDYNPTASIWRMKQLGETDKFVTENTNKNIDIPIIDFVDDADTE